MGVSPNVSKRRFSDAFEKMLRETVPDAMAVIWRHVMYCWFPSDSGCINCFCEALAKGAVESVLVLLRETPFGVSG